MAQGIVQVDSFTDRPFAGNPAAVCIMEGPADVRWMQDVAREMNLSETAFLYPEDEGYHLRWFTPASEVQLCGHATLATAHVLYEDGHVAPDAQIRFNTLSGLLTAEKQGELIELNFPASPVEEATAPAGLLEALGVAVRFVGRTQHDFLVEVESEEVVRGLRPDFARLGRFDVQGVAVTALSESPEYDFVSRFFAPALGVNEDPVTGAAHTILCPYWQQKLVKNEMVGFQASARGGVVHVRAEGDRVALGGRAVTVMRGELVF